MDCGDPFGSDDEQGNGVEAVGLHVDTPDDVVLLEIDRLKRLGAAGRVHHDMRRLDEVAPGEFALRKLAPGPSIAQNSSFSTVSEG